MPLENIPLPVVHIVDEDAQVRAATSYLLASHGYSPQSYASGADLLDSASLAQGCILLDLGRQDRSGLEILAELAARGVPAPVIMMSGFGDLGAAVRAIKLGAEDFLEKPCPERDLIAAIERALDSGAKHRGRIDGHATAVAMLARLSPRERQILQGLLAGMTNKEIARYLDLSPRTVEMHRASMMDDLQLSTLAQALRLAVDAQLTPLQGDTPQARPFPPRVMRLAVPKQNISEPMPPAVLDILEGTTECVFLLDRAWRFVYLNSNAVATIARGRSLLGAMIWETFPLAVGTRAWEQMQRAAADRQSARFKFFEPDIECWFDVNVRPVHSGLQVFFRDITRERRTHAALKLSEEALHLALDASGHGAWDWNITTGEVKMSERFLKRLGYLPTDVPGRFDAVRELVHPEDLPRFQEQIDEHLKGRSESFVRISSSPARRKLVLEFRPRPHHRSRSGIGHADADGRHRVRHHRSQARGGPCPRSL
ncbi:response regulator [Sphingomonas sp. SRS2]|uniref:response regulator n=1 Tax=Sphingomonas sp. SRS2 TaxID=133190 RepID=UPI00069669B3|nr:response regulator [Sphingomonas sp. SRS2]